MPDHDHESVELTRDFPDGLTDWDRASLLALAQRSRREATVGNGELAVEGIEIFRAAMAAAPGGGLGSKWEDCGDHCKHHLDDGEPTKYGVCYWACVIRGGPDAARPTVFGSDVATRIARYISR